MLPPHLPDLFIAHLNYGLLLNFLLDREPIAHARKLRSDYPDATIL